jgi:hypothetical protein
MASTLYGQTALKSIKMGTCSLQPTSIHTRAVRSLKQGLGPGKVYDTGGFAARHPYGFDLATDWTNHDRR